MNFQPTPCRYSTAATKPQSSSCGSVPVSSPAGRARRLPAAPCRAASRPRARGGPRRARDAARRTCTASRAARRSRSPRLDGPMRRVVHRVDPGERPAVRELDDLRRRRDRPDRVRGHRERDHLRPLGDQRAQMVEVEPALPRRARRRTVTTLSCASSSHGEMFASWSSRVTTTSSPSSPVPRRGAREREVERRHVRAERHLVGRRAEQVARRRARRADRVVGHRREVGNFPPAFALLASSSRRPPRAPSPAPGCRPGRRSTRSSPRASETGPGPTRCWSRHVPLVVRLERQ